MKTNQILWGNSKVIKDNIHNVEIKTKMLKVIRVNNLNTVKYLLGNLIWVIQINFYIKIYK
jgi:hypothetical protein